MSVIYVALAPVSGLIVQGHALNIGLQGFGGVKPFGIHRPPSSRKACRMSADETLGEETPTTDTTLTTPPVPAITPPSDQPVQESLKGPSSTDVAKALFVVPEGASKEPTLPVSSLADKVKGIAGLLVGLVAIGWVLNFSFSSDSPFLASDEPKVNTALQKYTSSTTSF